MRLAFQTELDIAAQRPEARILDSVQELSRLFEVAGSAYHGLDLDHGFVTRVLCAPGEGETPEAVIRSFGGEKRIFVVRCASAEVTAAPPRRSWTRTARRHGAPCEPTVKRGLTDRCAPVHRLASRMMSRGVTRGLHSASVICAPCCKG